MFPEEFSRRMHNLLGADAYAKFLSAAERPRNAALRINTLKTSTPPELTAYHLTAVPWARDGYYFDTAARPGLSPYHDAGLYYLQEASAMAPAELLEVRPGMRVLDLCAAPGGKSTQLAAAMRGEGLLVSNEIHTKRAGILGRNIERLGIANALVLNEHPQRLETRFASYFDRILVDAPCSGEGMFRKEETAVSDWSVETVQMCARRQLEILRSASKMLRGGGRIVYSTCTFAPEENEGVISAFLHEHPDFSVVAADAPYFSPARSDWIDAPAEGVARAFRLWPHELAGEGHFAAVLEKRGDAYCDAPLEPSIPMPPALNEFRLDNALALPVGKLISFGALLCLVPEQLPALRGLKVVRAGLALGELRKGRFEPAHAWALWLKDAASVANFPLESHEVAAFLAGETIPGAQHGWTLLTVDKLSLGWVKGSGGVLKNHLPKGLRRMVK